MVVQPISFQKDSEEFAKIFDKQKMNTKKLTQKFKELEDTTAVQNEEDVNIPKLVPLNKLTKNVMTKEQLEKEDIA